MTPLTGTSQRNAQAVVKARKSATRSAAKSTTVRQRASGSGGAVELPELRWPGDQSPSCALRRLYRIGRSADARVAGPAGRCNRGAKAGPTGMGGSGAGRGIRPGLLPAGDPAGAGQREAGRHHGGDRDLEGLRVAGSFRAVHAARLDVGSAGRIGWELTLRPGGVTEGRFCATPARAFSYPKSRPSTARYRSRNVQICVP